ncbi:hypothetical protein [Tardiphaga sp.]|jgi:hypothetical protein|uniref:hypothetical protein n=1 Tax=Tardiphaga sp. TaxID=1926292 RepID=UPI0037D99461
MTTTTSDVTITDTPHPLLSPAIKQARTDITRAGCIDFSGCNLTTAVIAFNEYDHKLLDDGKLSHSIETWPPAVKAKMRAELDNFSTRNGGAKIVFVGMGISVDPRGFVMALHWKPKA